MKCPSTRFPTPCLALAPLLCALAGFVPGLRAQDTPATPAPAAPTPATAPGATAPRAAATPAKPKAKAPTAPEDEAVTLSAFEVSADSSESYGALDSNSITRFRTDLDTLPVDASIFTKTFMDDVNATSIEEMLVQYAGAYAGSSDPSANGIAGEAGDRQGSAEFTLGGLKLSVRRDGFVAMSVNTKGPVGSTDSFSTERAELIHGPQSLLYGGAGGGGIANIVSKQGHFNRRRGSIRFGFDQYGSKRTEFDYNYGAKKVALRIALLNTVKSTQRYLIDSHAQGAYAQLAFRLPHSTTVRVWGQAVDAKSTNSTRLANVDNFLPAGDPRRGKNPRFLIATGQADNIRIGDQGINFGNIDSFGSRWSGDYIDDKFAGASIETVITPWLSTQLAVIYEDTTATQIAPGKTLLAAGATGNPFPGEAAVSVATNGSVSSLGPARKKAIRFSTLLEKAFFANRFTTQTILGVESFTSESAGINSGYFRADANWKVETTGPAATAYGRITMPTQYYSIQHGIPRYPLFVPASERVTVNGVNYVLQSLRIPNKSLVSQQNPLGLAGGSGTYTESTIHTRAFYLAHVSGFFKNKLKFLGGGRYDEQSGAQQGITSTGLKNALYDKAKLSYNLGLNYTVLPRVNLFVSRSTAFDPDTSTSDPYGNPLLSSVSHGTQAGIRYSTPGRGASVSLTYSSNVGTNQTQLVDQTWLDAINPAGINGRYTAFAGSDRWVNVDRKSNGVRLQLDLHPTRNWRATLNGNFVQGKVASDGVFKQLYNDQFYTNGGTVTYADKTPVLVDPAGRTGPKTTPLTLAMINDPAGVFRANPDADSGRITNATLITALTTVDPVHGTAATGVNGLPISAIQYTWTDPFGHKGELAPVAGNQYSPGPQYSFSFINHYTFTEGRLRGFGVGGGVSAALRNYAYYYTQGGTRATTGQRVPFILPSPAVFEYSVTYSRKLTRSLTWRSQINVNNALNHYYYVIVPTASNGTYENARAISTQRRVAWTNTISF